MTLLHAVTDQQANAEQQQLFAAVKAALGVTPNLMRTVGQSPAALQGYLGLNAALGQGLLPVALRERIALAVAQFNGCDYCISAHTYLAKNVAKLSDDAVQAARQFEAMDAKSSAALRFVNDVLLHRGHAEEASVEAVLAAGFSQGEVVELVLHVALNTLTNYVNNVARTDIDFPRVYA